MAGGHFCTELVDESLQISPQLVCQGDGGLLHRPPDGGEAGLQVLNSRVLVELWLPSECVSQGLDVTFEILQPFTDALLGKHLFCQVLDLIQCSHEVVQG